MKEMMESEKSLLGNHQKNNGCKQDSSTDVKTGRLNCMRSMIFISPQVLINYNGKTVTSQWKNLAHAAVTKWTKVTHQCWDKAPMCASRYRVLRRIKWVSLVTD